MSYFTSSLPLAIFVTLFKFSNSQMYPSMEIDQSEKREMTETEWEIRKQVLSNPEFIYSEFMKSSSMECLFDTFQVMTDLLAGKRYSAMSKFLFFFLVSRRKDLCEGKYDA